MTIHKAALADTGSMRRGPQCAVCWQPIKRVQGGQGLTWVHSDSGAVVAPNPPGYLITTEVIDLLYKAISYADCKALTPDEYIRVRKALDELAQTHQDGTVEAQPGDEERDALSAAYERWQAGEAAYQAARRERAQARTAYRELLVNLDPDDARADLDRRI